MVTLKGSPKGIMILIEDATSDVAPKELREKLTECASFFKEESLDVFMTSTSLTDVEVYELQGIVSEVLCGTKVSFIDHIPKMLPKQHSALDDLGDDEGITKFIRTKITTGEKIEYENNIIIIGDVEKGAEIISGGNVFVMGTLLGSVTVTNPACVVVAMKLMAENIKIGDLETKVSKNALKKLLSVPEIAYFTGTEIKIEQYS